MKKPYQGKDQRKVGLIRRFEVSVFIIGYEETMDDIMETIDFSE